METKIKKPKVTRLGSFSYRIDSCSLEGTGEKRKGYIIEGPGTTHVIPFKKSDPIRRRTHKVRECPHGKLELSPRRERLKLTISFDRETDSIEEFTKAFHQLIDDYIVDVINYEVKECLELEK